MNPSNFFGTAYKYITHGSTLGLSLSKHLYDANGNPWFHEIDKNLYLGGVPLSSMGHLQALKQIGITVVISFMEDYEISIKESQWNENDIISYQIKVTDFEAVSPEKMKFGVELIKKSLDKGSKVYLHCKCGRGRSASVMMCYLIKYGLSDGTKLDRIYKAHQYLKQKRSTIALNEKQFLSIDYFMEQEEHEMYSNLNLSLNVSSHVENSQKSNLLGSTEVLRLPYT